MDFDSGILRIEARINQIWGVTPTEEDTATSQVSNSVKTGRFASMVQQQLEGQGGVASAGATDPGEAWHPEGDGSVSYFV